MTEEKDTLNPNILTDEIEDTIDDLFKPSRKIEIDPLTNEVKEVSENNSPDEITPEADLDLEPSILAPPAPSSESKGEEGVEENLLELELELEPEIEEKPDTSAEKDELSALLDTLDQQLSTLEWEITTEQVAAAIDTLKGINTEPVIKDIAEARHLIRLMLDILSRMEDHPETIAASSPVVLKRGLEGLKQLSVLPQANRAALPQDLTDGLNATALELEKILKEGELPEETDEEPTKTPGTKATDIHIELKNHGEGNNTVQAPPSLSSMPDNPQESGSVSDKKEESLPYTATQLQGPAKPESKSIASSPSEDEILHVLDEHLDVLVSCIEKIMPVEILLKNTSGMEKLHRFQEGIRSTLEKEARRLAKLTGKKLGLPDTAALDMPTDTPEQRPLSPPWDKIMLISLGGKKVAFPDKEVCFYGPPVWSMKGKLGSLSAFPLKGLKKWPWSKIGPLLKGQLAALDEDVLKRFEFPVIKPEFIAGAGNNDGNCTCKIVTIMYDGSRGITILSDTEPVSEGTRKMTWKPTQEVKGPFEGTLKNGEETIPLCTVKSVLRAWRHD